MSTNVTDEQHDRRALDHLIRESLAYNTRDKVRELFSFIGKIHCYSPYNAMLLHIQRPDATLVLSVKKWSELGRKIKPGARPLVILATMGPVAFVFDETDTEGDPMPPTPEQGNLFRNPFAAQGSVDPKVWNHLLKHCVKHDIKIVDVPAHLFKAGSIQNYGKSCELKLNANHSLVERFVSLTHELAHLFCGHTGLFKKMCQDRSSTLHASQEIEAEAVAYLVAQRYGVASNSQNYLSAYVQGARFSLDEILVAAGKIQAMCNNTFRLKKEKFPL